MKETDFQHINFISITSKLSCCVSWSGRKIQKQILSLAPYTFNTCESVCYCIRIRGQKNEGEVVLSDKNLLSISTFI